MKGGGGGGGHQLDPLKRYAYSCMHRKVSLFGFWEYLLVKKQKDKTKQTICIEGDQLLKFVNVRRIFKKNQEGGGVNLKKKKKGYFPP